MRETSISGNVTPAMWIQANLGMTDSMGPGKLVLHMQNPVYTYDTYLVCIGLGPSISSVIDECPSYNGPSYAPVENTFYHVHRQHPENDSAICRGNPILRRKMGELGRARPAMQKWCSCYRIKNLQGTVTKLNTCAQTAVTEC